MKPHSIKFNEQDWQTLENLAKQLGFKSVGNMVNFACELYAEDHGEKWHGGGTWGSPKGTNRGRWKKQQG